jgi:hypothetical protein
VSRLSKRSFCGLVRFIVADPHRTFRAVLLMIVFGVVVSMTCSALLLVFRYNGLSVTAATGLVATVALIRDRFHLWQNLGEAVEKTVNAHRCDLADPATAPSAAPPPVVGPLPEKKIITRMRDHCGSEGFAPARVVEGGDRSQAGVASCHCPQVRPGSALKCVYMAIMSLDRPEPGVNGA